MGDLVQIGDVGFAKKDPCGDRPCARLGRPHLHRQNICGLTRSELLTIAYEKRELPDGLVLVHAPCGGPMVPIRHDEVDWARAGLVKRAPSAP